MNQDWQAILMTLFALAVAIPVHEFAHALSAVNNGDDGPRRANRLSIFPWDHFDPLGAAAVVLTTITGFGIGWGKPVLVNPNALKNPRWAMCKIAAWGPFANFLLAVGAAIPLRFGWVAGDEGLVRLLVYFLQVNLGLMLFNLVPVGPLDGAKVVAAFLPQKQAFAFSRFMEQYGILLLLLLLTAGAPLLHAWMLPSMYALLHLLLGPALL